MTYDYYGSFRSRPVPRGSRSAARRKFPHITSHRNLFMRNGLPSECRADTTTYADGASGGQSVPV